MQVAEMKIVAPRTCSRCNTGTLSCGIGKITRSILGRHLVLIRATNTRGRAEGQQCGAAEERYLRLRTLPVRFLVRCPTHKRTRGCKNRRGYYPWRILPFHRKDRTIKSRDETPSLPPPIASAQRPYPPGRGRSGRLQPARNAAAHG